MGDSAPITTDDRRRFVALAEEIIERIKETRGPEWWSDIRVLARELEETRRRFDPQRDFPGFFIVDVFRGKPDEPDAEVVGSVDLGGSSDEMGAGLMVSRDPWDNSSKVTWLWSMRPYDPSEELPSSYSPPVSQLLDFETTTFYPVICVRGTRCQAIKVLRRWIRAVRERITDIRNGDQNGARPAIDSVEAPPVASKVLPANEPTVTQLNDKPRVGYLGLLFDDARRRVGRTDFTETIELFQLPWGILNVLSKTADTPVALERLKDVWDANGMSPNPSPGTIVDAISDLRKRITSLGLTIQAKRKLGYMLCEKPKPTATASPALQLGRKSYDQRKASSRPNSKARRRTLRS
jgi:hypothetical protein